MLPIQPWMTILRVQLYSFQWQLDQISEASELFSPTVKLILLKKAVRNISDLRIVETLDEFQSTTQGHGKSMNIKYDTYYDLLINACVRYDKTL